MNWNNKELEMFGFTSIETRILESLQTAKQLNEIAESIKIPRTTIAYSLKSLLKRGLVERVKYGKRYRYISLNNNELSSAIRHVLDEIDIENRLKKGARIKITPEDEFIIHVGSNEIVPAFTKIAFDNKGERIRGIQHHRSFNEQVSVVTPAQIAKFNNAIIENKIILEGILNENAYQSYFDEIKSNPKRFNEEITSLGGRMADYYIFPEGRFDYSSEIWIFKSTTMIINWREKVAIEITNGPMTNFLREMYEYVKESSKKIDHNKILQEVLDEAQK